MNDESPNLVVSLLREIRADQKEMRAQIAVLAQGQVSIRAEIKTLGDDVKAIRDDIKSIRDDNKSIREGMHEIAIAIDGHSVRLERIEHHLGLDANKH